MLFFKTQPFFDILLKSGERRLALIYNHPFNQHLFKGDLPGEIFTRYLLNDIYYLGKFQETVMVMSEQNKGLPIAIVFKTLSDMIGTEAAMHEAYSAFINADTLKKFKPDASIIQYCNFIAALKHAPLLVQLSGLAPCLWTYRCLPVMYKMIQIASTHPYQGWISTYSAPAFIGITTAIERQINLLAKSAEAEKRYCAVATFNEALGHELTFYKSVAFGLFSQDSNSPMLTF